MSLYTLPESLLERWFAQFEFVPGMHMLAASWPSSVTTRELLGLEEPETTTRYLELNLDYIENPGTESLRQAIANLYTRLDAQDIRTMSGASEALSLLILTRTQPGDNILVEDPGYETITGIAQSRGIEVRRFSRQIEQDWKPDLAKLAGLADRRTRLISLTHAHHPTGALLQKEDMQAIAQIAEKVGALIVSDEVFRLITLDGTTAPSFIDVVEQAVVLGDMSKPWGLGGLRIGWVASRDHELLQQLSAARDYSSMSSSAPGEFLAEIALRQTENIMAPRLAAARSNLRRLAQAIATSRQALRWSRPQAGYTAFVQLPFATKSFCRYLAEEKRLLLLPGYVYGKAYEQFVRIGFGADALQFAEDLDILLQELEKWQSHV
ncbi:aminotransferase class I/II-fold pyridoxal phosphate-dependent enzyme [Ktedonosporobacter rubrisoli]|uniref:Aminotransferase class I/II-fold pyridoxal phosphate-dependent enzyme n=1 Tax=Ktedonosporobacter rubrisoli TaxID=2509675 RepID=A0A4P6JHR9_KTERU|nr:aminotransferase class I/II-fold pyridoxal phosphate-dependent enzyme [Ktedonosporobacter rubrisoli]QBD74578.1 aminotransferase class I/II-fold pyridoxal phosphate-dependent enzyme [Ktedonosporobacter rubrisoli]